MTFAPSTRRIYDQPDPCDVGLRVLERAKRSDRVLVATHLRVVREPEQADEAGQEAFITQDPLKLLRKARMPAFTPPR